MGDNGAMGPTRDEQRAWLAQWAGASMALREQHVKELQNMSNERALAASEAVLSLADPSAIRPARRSSSGLVAQQALLHRRVSP